MQNYKSLCAAVTIYATLVNIQTDRQAKRANQMNLNSVSRYLPLINAV